MITKVLGLLLIPVGLWLGGTVLAFASLIDPSLPEASWWAEYWKNMETGGGWGALGMGLVMVAIGGWLVLVSPASDEEAGSKRAGKIRDEDNR